jgi:exopolysaccharide biosynthesis predicted pyruvyltransferase EpsI
VTTLVADQRALVLDGLGCALAGRSSCVLVDYPRHLNVGDQAIWLGERAALRALGVEVTIACERADYRAARLRRHVGDGVICLHGGGNFGDLYPTHQALRERVLTDFRGRPVVQLAQSISFASSETLERTRRLISDHGDVTLLVRDTVSEGFAREHFDAEVALIPDSAFALGALERPRPASEPIVRLARRDREARDAGADMAGTFDWLEAPSDGGDRRELAIRRLRLALATGRREGGGRFPRAGGPALLRAFDDYASWSVRRGASLLARGRVVITDRLHGHILCTLMSIPHVILDSSDGKVRNYWETWTHASDVARWADDVRQARALAQELATS